MPTHRRARVCIGLIVVLIPCVQNQLSHFGASELARPKTAAQPHTSPLSSERVTQALEVQPDVSMGLISPPIIATVDADHESKHDVMSQSHEESTNDDAQQASVEGTHSIDEAVVDDTLNAIQEETFTDISHPPVIAPVSTISRLTADGRPIKQGPRFHRRRTSSQSSHRLSSIERDDADAIDVSPAFHVLRSGAHARSASQSVLAAHSPVSSPALDRPLSVQGTPIAMHARQRSNIIATRSSADRPRSRLSLLPTRSRLGFQVGLANGMRLVFGDVLGRGATGTVYLAELYCGSVDSVLFPDDDMRSIADSEDGKVSHPDEIPIQVAVKQLSMR